MTSSSDFSPMYASTSSINCERTVRSKVINASSVVFLLRLLLRTFVRSLDQSISLKRKKSTLFFGLRARRFSLSRTRPWTSSLVVHRGCTSTTRAYLCLGHARVHSRRHASRPVALSRFHSDERVDSVVLVVACVYVQTVYNVHSRAQSHGCGGPTRASRRKRRQRGGRRGRRRSLRRLFVRMRGEGKSRVFDYHYKDYVFMIQGADARRGASAPAVQKGFD